MKNSKEAESLKTEENRLELLITSAIEEKKPDSVDQLIKLVAEEGFSEEKIVEEILRLEKLGRIRLESDKLEAGGLKKRLFSSSTLWYWGVMLFCLMAVVSILAIPTDFYPFAYIRLVSGLVLLLYIPGFCLVKSLFPDKEIANLETVILSVSLSIVLVLLVALFWNFTPLGLSNAAITITLTALSASFATVTVIKGTSVPAEVEDLAEMASQKL